MATERYWKLRGAACEMEETVRTALDRLMWGIEPEKNGEIIAAAVPRLVELARASEEDVTKKEDIGDLYRDATDNTRDLLRVPHEAPKRNRVKPDPEDNPLAELDYKEFATLGDEAVRLWTEEAPRNSAGRSNK